MNTEILVLGTLHKHHKCNNLYSYEHIFEIINRLKPDVIGIEIRPEDMHQTNEYLTRFYPYEMIEVKKRFSDSCEVVGFDWFDKNSEGKQITQEYILNLPQNKLEQAFYKDRSYLKEIEMLSYLGSKQRDLVLNRAATEIHDGKLDMIIEVTQDLTELLLRHTIYEAYPKANKERNVAISRNIINIIKDNNGKRICFITGIAHRWFIVKAIHKFVNNSITELKI